MVVWFLVGMRPHVPRGCPKCRHRLWVVLVVVCRVLQVLVPQLAVVFLLVVGVVLGVVVLCRLLLVHQV